MSSLGLLEAKIMPTGRTLGSYSHCCDFCGGGGGGGLVVGGGGDSLESVLSAFLAIFF